jgi:hypothetical protein
METATLTILGGVSIYVIGQLVTKLFIEPVHELRLHIGRVAAGLVYWAHIYYSPASSHPEFRDRQLDASDALRTLAGELAARGQAIVWYPPFAWTRLIPTLEGLREARQALIALSSSSSDARVTEIDELRREVETGLRLRRNF